MDSLLAFTLALAVSFIPNTNVTTNYAEFAVNDRISKKLTIDIVALTLFSLFVLWILVSPFIKYFYWGEFESVIFLNFIGSMGVGLYGIADYFNCFLGVHGFGILLRNSSLIIGLSIMIFNFLLIPGFGVKGAANMRSLGRITYFVSI